MASHSMLDQAAPATALTATTRDVDFWQTNGVRRPAVFPPDSKRTGRVTTVRTNHYEVELANTTAWFLYDVVITPEKKTKMDNQKIMDRLQVVVAPEDFTPRGPYDGEKGLYNRNDIGSVKTFNDIWAEEGVATAHPVNVQLTRVNRIPFSTLVDIRKGVRPLDAMGAESVKILDILLGMGPLMRNGTVAHRRSVFPADPGLRKDLPGGYLEIAWGLYQSVRIGIDCILLNVDQAAAAMLRPMPLVTFSINYLSYMDRNFINQPGSLNNMSEHHRKLLSKFLQGVLVRPTHLRVKRIKSIKRLSKLTPRTYLFDHPMHGENTSVAQYFRLTHHKDVRLQNSPCVMVGPGKSAVPMEYLEVVENQLLGKTKKLSPDQTRDMVRETAQKPRDRLVVIRQSPNDFGYTTSTFLSQNGVSISSGDVTEVPARVLPAPPIEHAGKQSLQTEYGLWKASEIRFADARPSSAWAVVQFDTRYRQDLNVFIDALRDACRMRGTILPSSAPMVRKADPMGLAEDGPGRFKVLNEIKSTIPNLDLLICVVPEAGSSIRAIVKQWGDITVGVATQVVVSRKIPRDRGGGMNAYCANLALKINLKLGGINWRPAPNDLGCNAKRMIVMGIDVSHPSPGAPGPSMSALVSSFDKECSRYTAQVRIQPPRQEVIPGDDLKGMIEIAMMRWKNFVQGQNGKPPPPPEAIICFRDGVSEGQFQEVIETEVDAFHRAFANMKLSQPPNLTFVVVGKKHHFRMFPKNRNDEDKSGNCVSGTVIDRKVVNPFWSDFYLQSQAGLQGTSRPAHYSVLCDENKMTPDRLQMITYALCHVHTRATRAVSVPAPVVFADLVCARLAYHLGPNPAAGSIASSSEQENYDHETYKRRFMKIHARFEQRMYWM